MDKQNINFNLVYGTHKMTNGIMHGIKYGAIDTATGYNNADDLNKLIGKSIKAPCIITKFNQKDFDMGIEDVANNHILELGSNPKIVLIHSTLRTHNENLSAFKELKNLFPNILIGVSNFDLVQIKFLVDNGYVPDVIQLEYHPLFQPNKLVEYCKENGIIIMAYRPFAKGDLLKNPTILELSNKYKVIPSHLILKWLHHKNIIPVVSSNRKENIESNKKFYKIYVDESAFNELDNMNLGLEGSTCMIKFCKMDGEIPIL